MKRTMQLLSAIFILLLLCGCPKTSEQDLDNEISQEENGGGLLPDSSGFKTPALPAKETDNSDVEPHSEPRQELEPQQGFVTGRYNSEAFSEGLAPFYADIDGQIKIGFVDKSGNIVIKPVWEQFYYEEEGSGDYMYHQASFREGLALVFLDNKAGFIDKTGKVVIKPQFVDARSFSEGLAAVAVGTQDDPKWGFIDKKGGFVIEPKWNMWGSYNLSFNNGLALLPSDGKYGFIDKSGKFVIEPQFVDAEPFFEELAAVAVGEFPHKWGFIDKQGNYVIEPTWNYVDPFIGGLAVVHNTSGNCYIIDTKGDIVTEADKNSHPLPEFYDGLALFREDSWSVEKQGNVIKHGYKDENGNIVIQPEWDYPSFHFSEGYAVVCKDGDGLEPWKSKQWGVIDKTGKLVIELQDVWEPANFNEIGSSYLSTGFSEGLLRVNIKDDIFGPYIDHEAFIDINGNIVIDLGTLYNAE